MADDTNIVPVKPKKKRGRPPGPMQGLTGRQRRILLDFAKTGNYEKTAENLGTSANYVSTVIRRAHYQMVETTDELGLSDAYVFEQYLKAALNATETKFFAHQGEVKEEREVVSWGPRLEALDMLFKLRGSYAQGPAPVVNNAIQVVVEHIGADDK